MFRTKLRWYLRASTILSSARRSAELPYITKKSIRQQTEAPQKDLRPRQTSIRRDESNSALTIFSGQHLESYFENTGQNDFYKNSQNRFGFSLPRAFQWWSRNCRSPSGLLAN